MRFLEPSTGRDIAAFTLIGMAAILTVFLSVAVLATYFPKVFFAVLCVAVVAGIVWAVAYVRERGWKNMLS